MLTTYVNGSGVADLLCILGLYDSRSVGKYYSSSAGLYGSRSICLMRVGRELMGEKRYAKDRILLREARDTPDDYRGQGNR